VDPSTLPAWNSLIELAAINDETSIAQLLRADATRTETMTVHVPVGESEILVDFSHQNVSNQVLETLLQLAVESDLETRRTMLSNGSVVNESESRAALHMDERVGEAPLRGEVVDRHTKVAEFVEAVRSGEIGGAGGSFTHVVNVGIGGSDLGPALVHQALSAVSEQRIQARFVSNVDDHALDSALSGLDPSRTLFVFCSKSFSTMETIVNAKRAQRWLSQSLDKDAVARQCVVVSSEPERAVEAGILAAHTFVTPLEVGGRFSVSSAMNLANEIAFGSGHIARFRDGMAAMDRHFLTAPFARNAPVLMGLIGVWNRTFLDRSSKAVVVYLDALANFVPFVQQLEMESNGKRVLRDGSPVSFGTSPVVWGGVGTNAQHAFMQLVHQGTDVVPVDFIGVSRSGGIRNDALIANLVAQAEALAVGRSLEHVTRSGVAGSEAHHRVMPGNRPSTSVLLRHLDPESLGALVALYEHATFVQGAVWGINSFDQWGVELGKQLADDLLQRMGGTGVDQPGPSELPPTIAWHLRDDR
jgi:glucose-6-phosphate isomerase